MTPRFTRDYTVPNTVLQTLTLDMFNQTVILIVQKMKVVIALFALLAVALAKPSPQLPPGITAAECPNYPFCGAGPGADQVPANQIL